MEGSIELAEAAADMRSVRSVSCTVAVLWVRPDRKALRSSSCFPSRCFRWRGEAQALEPELGPVPAACFLGDLGEPCCSFCDGHGLAS